MNTYVKAFLQRGLLFGGFGPIVSAIVFFILSLALPDFSLSGGQVLAATVSTYLLAFIQAGASIFNQIEHWSTAKSLGWHFGILYVAYSLCYILNTWIPFEPMVLAVFTGIFVTGYAVIWTTVYFCVRATRNQLNAKL